LTTSLPILEHPSSFDPVAHEHAARLERLIPGEPEVAPVDRGRGAEAKAITTPWVTSATFIGRVENDFASDIANRQIADNAIAAITKAFHATAPERHRRVLLYFEEVRRSQVRVPLLRARVDRGGVDLHLGR
jgi:hypothetical protein